jgi:hypothetical protein
VQKMYATPMLPGDAARTIERIWRIMKAETDRLEREVDRLNQRERVPRSVADERLGITAVHQRIPRLVTPAKAKAHVLGPGRSRKTPAKAEA